MPWGEVLAEQKAAEFSTPYQFNGKELDQETGLYNYGARYYDPSLSVWLGVDPLADQFPGWSPYNYTMNNPINMIDPDGRSSESVHEDKDGNIIAEYDDGDHNVYRHNDLGGNGQHIDGQRSHLDQKRELYGTSGGGEHQLLSSAINITKQSAKAVWDSPIIRAVTPDAITFGVETNGYIAGGGSSVPIGGLLMLHGPEAGSLHSFSDVGLGVGVTFNAGVFLSSSRVMTFDPNNIRSEDFGGFRTSGSLDVGEGIIGGINLSINNPTRDRPFILSAGASIGVGATSPFGVGGNINEGYTILHSSGKR